MRHFLACLDGEIEETSQARKPVLPPRIKPRKTLSIRNSIENSVEEGDNFNSEIKSPQNSIIKLEKEKAVYKCTVCQSYFSSRLSILRHVTKAHNQNATLLSCAFCDLKFELNTKLIEHVHSIHNDFNYQFKCKQCIFAYKDNESFKKHKYRDHPKTPREPKFSCAACSKKIYRPYDLKKHTQNSHGDTQLRPFKCNHCPSQFEKKKGLDHHLRFKHTKSKSFSCHICGREFNFQSNLKGHLDSIHKENRSQPFKCEICSKSFKSKAILKIHALIHKNRQKISCGHCNVSVTRKSSLMMHIQRLHSTDVYYHKCEICKKSYKTLENLSKHKHDMHFAGRRYACEECGKNLNISRI